MRKMKTTDKIIEINEQRKCTVKFNSRRTQMGKKCLMKSASKTTNSPCMKSISIDEPALKLNASILTM